MLLLHVCTTVHARCLQITARPTRVLLYTRNTRTLPHGRHVCCCIRTPRDDRSEHARAAYTWARPPTCTPRRPPDRQPLRAPVVRLQYARALATHGNTRPRVHRIRPFRSSPPRARPSLYYTEHYRPCSDARFAPSSPCQMRLICGGQTRGLKPHISTGVVHCTL